MSTNATHPLRQSRTGLADVLGYVPPVAHFTKALVYVDCYAIHPSTGRLTRKRYKLNRIKGAAARRAAAHELCEKLTVRLRAGWIPWTKNEPITHKRTMRQALEEWSALKKRTRFSAPHNYLIQARLMEDWCYRHGLLDGPPTLFTKQHARAYMHAIAVEKKVSNNTFNGYLTIVKGFFTWCQRREYVDDNPFQSVERKRKAQKIRTILTPEERASALKWFRKNDPAMVPVCLFVFHTLIRPRNELARLKVEDIDLERGEIRFKADQTKTLSDRHPAIPPHMVAELRRLPMAKADPTWYLVGRGLEPGPEKVNLNMAATRWGRMRKALKWPATKQLMSLRDSGIVQLIRDGVPLESVMKQADHKSLQTTNHYVQHAFPYAQEDVRSKASKF